MPNASSQLVQVMFPGQMPRPDWPGQVGQVELARPGWRGRIGEPGSAWLGRWDFRGHWRRGCFGVGIFGEHLFGPLTAVRFLGNCSMRVFLGHCQRRFCFCIGGGLLFFSDWRVLVSLAVGSVLGHWLVAGYSGGPFAIGGIRSTVLF